MTTIKGVPNGAGTVQRVITADWTTQNPNTYTQSDSMKLIRDGRL